MERLNVAVDPAFYDELFRHGYNRDPEPFQLDWVTYHIAKRLRPNGTSVSSVLDMGCGRGHLWRRIGASMLRFACVDFSQECVTDLVRVGCDARLGRIEDVQLGERFDVICALDCLEHLEPDQVPRALTNMVAHASPSGTLLITVGDHSDPVNGIELHQTRKRIQDWRTLLEQYGEVFEAVDRATFECGGARIYCFEVRP